MSAAIVRLVVGALALSCAACEAEESRDAQRWTPASIATDQYESTPTFTPDGRELYFMLSDRRFQNYRLMWSRCERGAWTAPQPVPFGAPAPIIEADPFVTHDGRRLYFISARHDPDNEDFDIYVVERLPGGGWSEPQRLPEPVSSPGAELLPRADATGRLWFGSNRPGGSGEGDIYTATLQPDGSWRVQNVGPPVSTAHYEYEVEISADARTLVLVANRGERSRLYRFEREGEAWVEKEQIPGFRSVFQVGPLLSPRGDRLLFAQADEVHSGEIYLIDLAAAPDRSWPPRCGK